jgi:hypothetical protein
MKSCASTDRAAELRREEKAAVLRVLRLVDGYMSTQPKSTLLAWGGGMMTWKELRWHVKGAIKLARKL